MSRILSTQRLILHFYSRSNLIVNFSNSHHFYSSLSNHNSSNIQSLMWWFFVVTCREVNMMCFLNCPARRGVWILWHNSVLNWIVASILWKVAYKPGTSLCKSQLSLFKVVEYITGGNNPQGDWGRRIWRCLYHWGRPRVWECKRGTQQSALAARRSFHPPRYSAYQSITGNPAWSYIGTIGWHWCHSWSCLRPG